MSTLTKNQKLGTEHRWMKRSEFTIGLVVIVLFLAATFFAENFFTSYNL